MHSVPTYFLNHNLEVYMSRTKDYYLYGPSGEIRTLSWPQEVLGNWTRGYKTKSYIEKPSFKIPLELIKTTYLI